MSITFEQALNLFITDMEYRNLSKNTIKDYTNFVTYFINFVSNKSVSEITKEDLKRYTLFLRTKEKLSGHPFQGKSCKGKKLSSKTINTYVRHVCTFLRFLYRERYIDVDPTKDFVYPKVSKKIPDILTEIEIENILNGFNTNCELGCRNACIFACMVDSGLRRSDVLRLKTTDIRFQQNLIMVRESKGNKDRIVPMGVVTKKLLMKYMFKFRPKPEIETDRLFLKANGEPITADSLKMLYVRLSKKYNRKLYSHLLRHTFASRYLMNGGDMRTLQLILGHSSLEMVRVYSHIANSYTVKSFKNFSPLDNVMKKRLRRA